MKPHMKYHNNYLEHRVQRDGWNVVSLNGYSEVTELFDYPSRILSFYTSIEKDRIIYLGFASFYLQQNDYEKW